MTIKGTPYFMENAEWYTFDEINCKYVLTDKAPQAAIDSYNEFYKGIETQNDEDFDESSNLGVRESEEEQVNKLFNLGKE